MALLTKIFVGHVVATGSNDYTQIANASLQKNLDKMIITPWGHTLPMFVAENGRRPELPFDTHQVATALGEFGLLGADPGVCSLGFKKVANQTGRVADATAEHVRYTANNALGYINSITAGNKTQAVCSNRLALLADASNPAYVYSGTDTVSETPAAGEHFILGPIGHNASAIEGCNDLQINFNPRLFETAADEYTNEPYFAAIDGITPDVSFTTTDPAVWALDGVAITGSVRINLIRKSNKTDRYADAATQHIVFTMTDGMFSCEEISGPKAATRLMITPISPDGSTSPITFATGSAVTIANPV